MATINGTNNDDKLNGTSGADMIDGLLGKDTMAGFEGDDTYVVDNIGDKVVEKLTQAAGGGIDTVMSSVSYSIASLANVENITLTGGNQIDATGNKGENLLIGNTGNNVLNGGAGADVMAGAEGNDTYYVDNALDQVKESFGITRGIDTIVSSIAFTDTVSSVENYTFNTKTAVHFTGDGEANVIKGGSGDDVIDGKGGYDTLYGNAGNDTLAGGAQQDVLDGGTGADDMTGNAGGDSYYVDNVGDKVHEGNTNGTDTITASISIDLLADEVEQLYLTGSGALHATGNALDNYIHGNDGANLIDGGLGGDTMDGGKGSDTYIVDDDWDDVAESVSGAAGGIDLVKSSVTYGLSANIENLTLTGSAMMGFGNALNNIMTGNDAANVLDGKAGSDTLIGGKGNDIYVVDNIGDKIVESIANAKGGGNDAVHSEVNFSLAGLTNVEELWLSGVAIKATGNALDNTLSGNASANILDGGKGADEMAGDNGNDTYYVDNLGDQVHETADDSSDAVISTIDLANAFAGVENYTFKMTAAVHFTGDAGDNIVNGGSGMDLISGGGGHDSLYGNGGNDQLYGGALQDLLNGGAGADKMTGFDGNDIYIVDNVGDKANETGGLTQGNDTVYASVSVDLLWDSIEDLHLNGTGALHATGNSGNNFISGNDAANLINGAGGDDQLDGLKGNDTLTGGTGGDTFIFNSAEPGNEGHDTITDFVKAEDVLSFAVGDFNNSGTIDIADLVACTSVVDHGIGKAVDVTFADGGIVNFAGAGTGQIQSIAELVDTVATQIHVN